ncbi:MAG: hypothetical protein PVJ84_07650 [Desulfobacteraceae bacterium]|jgi:hypothetical protein
MPISKEEFLAQIKKKYDDLNYKWNIERNKLEAKAQIESAEVRKKFEKKREDFRKYREELKDRLSDLDAAGENAWGEMKEGVESAWKALRTAFEKATSQYKKK